jgi:type IV fimbrial biogenesis protein FimT
MQIRTGRASGFTLFELMLTLAVAASVLVVGLASMGGTIARHRQAVELNTLAHAIHLARKESIMRKRVVSLCPSSDGRRCQAATDWSAGWLLFDNRDRDEPPQVDAGEGVIERHTVDPAMRITANRRGFTLRATFLRATNGTLVVCGAAGRVPAKALVVSYTGRPRVALRTPSGDAYACAD